MGFNITFKRAFYCGQNAATIYKQSGDVVTMI